MHIKALRMSSIVDDRFICDIEGKFVHVVLRSGIGITPLPDRDGGDACDALHPGVLGDALDPVVQLSHALTDADDGDVILLHYPTESVRQLLLQLLEPGKTYH